MVAATGTKPSPNLALDDLPSSVSFTVKNDGAGNFWSVYLNGSELTWGTNGTDIVLASLNSSSALGGGCVYVLPATSGFSGTIAVPNATRLVVELGVQGLSYTVAPSATCSIADYNSGAIYRYASGTLTFKEDMTNSAVSSLVWLNSTNINATKVYTTYLYLGSLTSDPVSPIAGEMWYNSVSGQFKCYNGSTIVIGSGTVGPSGPAGTVAGQAFSFLVFNNATSNYMVSGLNGSIIYSSSNASQVINYAGANASLVKGSVFIKAGDYSLTNPILLQNMNNTFWSGEGIGTHLFIAPNPDKSDNTKWIYQCVFLCGWVAQSNSIANITIQNMFIDGNKAGQTNNTGSITSGFATVNIIGSAKDVVLQNLQVMNGLEVGISFSTIGSTSVTSNCKVLNCRCMNNNWDNIDFMTDSGAKTYGNLVQGCTFGGNSGDDGFGFGGDGSECYQNLVTENTFLPMYGLNGSSSSGSSSAWYSIILSGACSNNTISNNVLNCYSGISIQAYSTTGSNLNQIVGNNIQILGNANCPNPVGVTVSSYCYNTTIQNNYIFGNDSNSYSLCFLAGSYGSYVEGNTLRSTSGYAVWEASPNIYVGNDFRYCGSVFRNGTVTGVPNNQSVTMNNQGWNPRGYITTPVLGTLLCDSGSSSTFVSGTTYTCTNSPKILYISGGTVTAIVFDGQTLFSSATTISIPLQPGDTFSVTWSGAPTIKVFGE